jgi:hypothetical protein
MQAQYQLLPSTDMATSAFDLQGGIPAAQVAVLRGDQLDDGESVHSHEDDGDVSYKEHVGEVRHPHDAGVSLGGQRHDLDVGTDTEQALEEYKLYPRRFAGCFALVVLNTVVASA